MNHAKNPLKTVHRDAEQLKHASAQLLEDVENVGKAVQHLAGDSWKLARQTATGYADDARDRIQTRLKTQPVQSLLIAVGVGFLVGRLMR